MIEIRPHFLLTEEVMGKYKETPRYNVISMRISDTERKELQEIAYKNSLSISDLMRQAVDIYARYQEPIASGHQFA